MPETVAGASAAAEGERRQARRVEAVRKDYGDLAAAVADAVVKNEIASSWLKGSSGESRLASWIAKNVGDAVIPLHDRLIPGTKSNIDHLFIAATGVWIVDAKSYAGKIEARHSGPVWRRDTQLFVGNRNRTKLVSPMKRQITAVRTALAPDPDFGDAPIYGVLCFTDSDWALLDSPFSIGDVWVTYPRALRKRLKKAGPIPRESMVRIAQRLALSLPPAA